MEDRTARVGDDGSSWRQDPRSGVTGTLARPTRQSRRAPHAARAASAALLASALAKTRGGRPEPARPSGRARSK